MVEIPKRGGWGGSAIWEKFPNNPVFFLEASLTLFNKRGIPNYNLEIISRLRKYSRVETALNSKVTMGQEDLSDQKIFIRWARNGVECNFLQDLTF